MSRTIKWAIASYRRPRGSKQAAILAEDGLARGGKKTIQDSWDASHDKSMSLLYDIAYKLIGKGMSAQEVAQKIRTKVRNIPYRYALDIVESAISRNEWKTKKDRTDWRAIHKAEEAAKLTRARAALRHVFKRKDNVHVAKLYDLVKWASDQGVIVKTEMRENGWRRHIFHLTVGEETVIV